MVLLQTNKSLSSLVGAASSRDSLISLVRMIKSKDEIPASAGMTGIKRIRLFRAAQDDKSLKNRSY
jgi:hypothetical protein